MRWGPERLSARYPYAKPAPLTYMKPGQSFWNGRKAHGGWYQASIELKKMLVRMGLPATVRA